MKGVDTVIGMNEYEIKVAMAQERLADKMNFAIEVALAEERKAILEAVYEVYRVNPFLDRSSQIGWSRACNAIADRIKARMET